MQKLLRPPATIGWVEILNFGRTALIGCRRIPDVTTMPRTPSEQSELVVHGGGGAVEVDTLILRGVCREVSQNSVDR